MSEFTGEKEIGPETMTFGPALELLRSGFCVARIGWNGPNMFICKQVPSIIPEAVIPNMQSLPESAKRMLVGDGINYQNQLLIVNLNRRTADSWVPSSSDLFACDWVSVYPR